MRGFVMAGHGPAIHLIRRDDRKSWMPGPGPGMTSRAREWFEEAA